MRLPVLPLALLVLAAGAASVPQRSHADTTGTGGTGGTTAGDLNADDFTIEIWIPDPDDKTNTEFIPLNKIDEEFYFGRARCECKTPIRLRVDVVSTSRGKLVGKMNGNVTVGTGELCECKDANCRANAKCKELGGSRKLSALATSYVEFETNVGELFAGNTQDAPDACERRIDSRNVAVRPDVDNNMYPDFVKIEPITLDGEAPPAPAGLAVSSGNEALNVSWTALPFAEIDDLLGYSVFCARGGAYAPFAGDFAGKRRHETKESLCPTNGALSSSSSLVSQALLTPRPAEKTAAPAPLRNLDPNFLCAGFLTSGQSARITGLENHVPYVVGVAAVDIRYNASVLENAVVAWPFPTRDFYTTYRADGGTAEGGFCTLGGHRPASGSGWWGLLLAAVAVALRRPRSRR